MRNLIQIVESASVTYLHSSQAEMPVGTVLEPRRATGATAAVSSEVEAIFEKARPADMPSRASSVYMTDDWDCLEAFGLADDAWVYAVEPQGPVTRLDHDWHHEAASIGMRGMLDDGIRREITKLATRYWSGKPKSAYPHWEYLASSAVIRSVLQELE